MREFLLSNPFGKRYAADISPLASRGGKSIVYGLFSRNSNWMIWFCGRARKVSAIRARIFVPPEENSGPALAGLVSRASLRNQIDGAFVNIELTSIIIVDGGEEGETSRALIASRGREKVAFQFSEARISFQFFGANVFSRGASFRRKYTCSRRKRFSNER